MKKLIFKEVGYSNHILLYIDFEDEDNVQVEVDSHSATHNFVLKKKYTLNKEQSNKFSDLIGEALDCDLSHEEDTEHLTDMTNTDYFVIDGMFSASASWSSGYEPDIKSIAKALVCACPEIEILLKERYL